MSLTILIHDFAGHPFQVELSRKLAARGHQVTHAWFAADQGPKGVMIPLDQDPPSLNFHPIGAEINYSKTNFLKRRAGDLAYGQSLANLIGDLQPDVVISGNTPTEAQEPAVRICRGLDIPFVFWCQDFYSIAASELLARKLPGIGHLVGAWYRFLERRQMRWSVRVLHITKFFVKQTDKWKIPRSKVEVIPNWGALDRINVLPRDTQWGLQHDLGAGARFLYSGTLALKHNPALLEALGLALSSDENLIVVSAGVGVNHLKQRQLNDSLPALRLLPLQSFEVMDEVLASGDILLCVIERSAGKYSVPSKMLSYLCAGRPIVLAAPAENLAASILRENGAGTVVDPEDISGFVAAALSLRDDPARAAAAGAAGRAWAEKHFDLEKVADRFEALFVNAINAVKDQRRCATEVSSSERVGVGN